MANEIEEVMTRVVEDSGCEVVQIKRGPKHTVEVMVDRDPGGVTVSDLTSLTRGIHAALEEDGTDPGEFSIEVVSPGLDRPLLREKDFVRFAGEQVHVKLRDKRAADGRKNFKGVLKGVEDGQVVVQGPDDEEPWTFQPGEIASAKLVPQLPTLRDKKKGRSSTSGRSRKPTKSRRKRPKDH